jgi:CubicO group peptidase (beta-lactamase class C family)
MKEKKPGKLRKIIKYISIFLGIVIIAAAVLAFSLYDFSNPDDLSLHLERKFKKLGVTGMAVTLFDDKEITYFKGLGYYDIENEKEITKDTIFQIASISKTATGTAIMQLYENGLLDIDEDINSYLPFDVSNPNYKEAAITARMLLTHTSSICDNYDIYDALYTLDSGGGDSPVTLEQFAKGYLTEGGKWYDAGENYYEEEPGTFYEYSNCGYALLGYLLEAVTGMDFAEYCSENIFEPLEMDSASWFLSDTDKYMLAVPYDDSGEAYPFYGFATYPDGCLRVSSADYAKFLMAMMGGGEYMGARILDEATVAEIMSPQIPGLYDDQGLTWLLHAPEEFGIDCGEYLVPGHSGGDPGVCTIAFYSPDTKKGAIVFINSDIRQMRVPTLLQIFTRMAREVVGK